MMSADDRTWTRPRARDRDRLELIRALFPDLADELDAAAARHIAPGAAEALDARLDAAAVRLMPQAAFADIVDPESARRIERSFAAARSASARLGIAMPEAEAFAEAGVDYARLGSELASEPGLMAVPAPFGCGADAWQGAFAHDETDATTLVLATEAEKEFDLLDAAPSRTPAVTASGVTWTLRLVPAAERPPVLGLGFSHGPHVTLPEILMLQLMLIVDGAPPIDTASFTWLEGALSGGRLAARHVYDESERAIRITCREIGNQGPHLGARTPIG